MIHNRINQYLSEVDNSGLTPYGKKGPHKSYIEPPPIVNHKDNISQLTIFNTGWSEGYEEGYEYGLNMRFINKVTYIVIGLVLGFALGISIGIWL